MSGLPSFKLSDRKLSETEAMKPRPAKPRIRTPIGGGGRFARTGVLIHPASARETTLDMTSAARSTVIRENTYGKSPKALTSSDTHHPQLAGGRWN